MSFKTLGVNKRYRGPYRVQPGGMVESINEVSLFFRLLWSQFKLQSNTMGIHGLAKLIADQAPGAIKEQDIKNYFGNNCRSFFLTHWFA